MLHIRQGVRHEVIYTAKDPGVNTRKQTDTPSMSGTKERVLCDMARGGRNLRLWSRSR